MVRQAKRPNPQKRQVSMGASVPAPVGGWDAKNPISNMPIQNALILDNWIPRPGYCELRRGYVEQVTGSPGPVESMIAFRGDAGGDKLFAASAGGLYDVTTKGAPIGSPVLSGLGNNRWNYVAFANAAGEWAIACNGADAPIGYNGGAWAALPALTFTGPPALDPTKLFNVFSHAGRLYFLEQGALRVWFPDAGAVGGACGLLDLSSIFTKGGRLICGSTWSWSFGTTAAEFLVFMTDQGQVAIYQGVDPTDASTFSIIGVYDLGLPLGPRALVKFGGDLAVVTTDGVIPMSQGLRLDRTQQAEVALTGNILNAFASAVKAFGQNYGWQGILYPGSTPGTDPAGSGGSLAIFNIPTATLESSMQFVQNVLTGAWCRFLNINAFCWELANQNIYFGTANGVYQWDQGASDNGEPIVGEVMSAFSALGRPGMNKYFTAIRPLMYASPLVAPSLDINVDYDQSAPTATPVVVTPVSAPTDIRFDWTSVGAIGYVAATHMVVNLVGDASARIVAASSDLLDTLAIDNTGDGLLVDSNLPFDVQVQLLGFDVMYAPGGQL